MDRIDLLEAFLAVAESGSFTGGAARLGATRALVSKRVAALERMLGARLFARTTRRVGLTAEGAALLPRARQILNDFRAALDELAATRGEPRGRLRLTAPMSFAIRHLGRILADFIERFPGLELEVTLSDRFVDLIEERFDLALRIGDLPDSSLIARQLAPVRTVACAAPAYLERYGEPREPAELARHRCLHYSYLATGQRWRFFRADRVENVTVDDALVANNGDLLAAIAEAGGGSFCCRPSSSATRCETAGLCASSRTGTRHAWHSLRFGRRLDDLPFGCGRSSISSPVASAIRPIGTRGSELRILSWYRP